MEVFVFVLEIVSSNYVYVTKVGTSIIVLLKHSDQTKVQHAIEGISDTI